ncbi:MAG: hypothetical protein QW520_08270 [Methanomassiliicoccales archaeon]
MATQKSSSSSKKKGKKETEKNAQIRLDSKSSQNKEEIHEHDEKCGCISAAEELFGKNGERSYALRDLWFESLNAAIDEQVAPELNKREMLFLTLSNSIFDMMMDILPEQLAVTLAHNLDDYLAVTLVNKKYKVDLLRSFQEEFLEEKGSNFETQEDLAAALADFEQKFWNTPRSELGNRSPNSVIEAALKHYKLL